MCEILPSENIIIQHPHIEFVIPAVSQNQSQPLEKDGAGSI